MASGELVRLRESKLRCRYRTDELLMSEMRIRLRSPGEEVPKDRYIQQYGHASKNKKCTKSKNQ